eukprot:TRINITY_DN8734_c0_g1_i1.p1 TRINITY_DN8734_c0_g1~~TRINITY_DN8734_c0_g1_i1.p1  ORF type:complete len:653 (+),score=132.16 TRINITY_DN8734_c0_g1_i1:152-1960(+)
MCIRDSINAEYMGNKKNKIYCFETQKLNIIMSKVSIKMGNYSGYHSKKLTSTIQPQNLPKNQAFKLIIDILQDKICLFAEKDEKNYEAIETLLTEQDIVNLVNQNPIVNLNEQSLVLAYEGFPKVELREVKQFTDTSQFKKTQQQSQQKQSNAEVKPAQQLSMSLEEMYEQLKQNYNEELNKYEQRFTERKDLALQEQSQIKEKIEEMEKLKKDQKEFEAIKTLTIKTDFLGKEALSYDKYLQQLTIFKNNQNKITQTEYLKMIYLIQQIEIIYQNYSLKRECLEKNLVLLLDDLRRHRIRKNTKEYEETEKRMAALSKEFQQLIEEHQFITSDIPQITEKFLQGDESQIYSQKLDSLSQNAENSIMEAQQMGQQLQEKQKEVNEYRKKFDEMNEQNRQLGQDNEELKKQNGKVNQELSDNLEWKKKYLEITILMEELQAKHDTTLKQLEAGIFLKEKEIKFYKNQVYEKYQVIQELEKQGNENFRDQRAVQLQTELEKLKKENDQEIQKREESEIELEIQKDKVAELEIKIQYYDQQLTTYKLNENQMKQGQIAVQSVQNELKFSNNEIGLKEQKNNEIEVGAIVKGGRGCGVKGKGVKIF